MDRKMKNSIKIFLVLVAMLFIQFCKEYGAHIARGYQKELELKTVSDLKEIQVAIGDYMMKENKMPQASNIFELMRILRPQYLSHGIFYDAWNHDLLVQSSRTHIEITSKGIDGVLGTRDDIKVKM